MTDYLTTRVQVKTEEAGGTTFLLGMNDYPRRGLVYPVPFYMPDFGEGDRIEFVNSNFPIGAQEAALRIKHQDYGTVAFYKRRRKSPFLRFNGKMLALYEMLIQANKEREARDAANERTVIGAADGREVIE